MVYDRIKYQLVDIDSDQVVEDSKGMLERYPWRGPAAAVHAMQPYISGKVVCDLGCGGGDLVWLMGRWASKAIGVENNRKRYITALRRVTRNELNREGGAPLPLRTGDNVSIERRDYFKEGVPDADVYYFWPDDARTMTSLMSLFSQKVEETNPRPFLVIAGARPGFLDSEKDSQPSTHHGRVPQSCRLLRYVDKQDGKVIRVPFREDSALANWPDDDEWCLCIIPMAGAKI